MSVAELPKPITAEDLADRPDDGVERDLIRGELRERPMTRRNPDHSEVMITIGTLLRNWVLAQGAPRGKVSGGEVGFRLRRVPETFVGIDVAYVSPEMAAARDRKLKFYDGPPVLAVEIYSPSDQIEDIEDKLSISLEVGTVVWLVHPYHKTVTVHQPGKPVKALDADSELSADPYLPGFRVRVAEFFE
jgi:Uma2 family endonuclease